MTTKYEWAKIELLGHRVRYGRCSVVDFMDGKLLRVEVPYGEPRFVSLRKNIYTRSAMGMWIDAVVYDEYKKAFPERSVLPSREQCVDDLATFHVDEQIEQFAFVEEYPFSALYCRTPMTEENVRKAVQPWRPVTSSSSTQSNDDPWDGEDDSEPSSDMGKAMRCVLTPEDERLWNHKADEEAHEAPVVNETPRAPHFVDLDEHSYVAAHIDLDECVRCHGGIKTHPLVSIDGSAVLGEHCLVCKATWWHAFPVMPTPAMVRPLKTT